MREKMIAIILSLLLFPAVAQDVRLEHNHPFYCSKDIATVAYIPEMSMVNALLVAYEGSPIWVTVDEGGLKTHKQRLTIPNQYYKIKLEAGSLFVKVVIQSEGESTFDIDSGWKGAGMPVDQVGENFFGGGIWLSENAFENYEIRISLSTSKEDFWFYTLGLDAGEVWVQDYEKKIRYGPLTPTNVHEAENRRDYEINTTGLDKNKGWYITFTNLRGTEKFYVYGDFENNTITVLRPRNFFTSEEDYTHVPGGPRLPW